MSADGGRGCSASRRCALGLGTQVLRQGKRNGVHDASSSGAFLGSEGTSSLSSQRPGWSPRMPSSPELVGAEVTAGPKTGADSKEGAAGSLRSPSCSRRDATDPNRSARRPPSLVPLLWRHQGASRETPARACAASSRRALSGGTRRRTALSPCLARVRFAQVHMNAHNRYSIMQEKAACLERVQVGGGPLCPGVRGGGKESIERPRASSRRPPVPVAHVEVAHCPSWTCSTVRRALSR